jgi:hypothetical protein
VPPATVVHVIAVALIVQVGSVVVPSGMTVQTGATVYVLANVIVQDVAPVPVVTLKAVSVPATVADVEPSHATLSLGVVPSTRWWPFAPKTLHRSVPPNAD